MKKITKFLILPALLICSLIGFCACGPQDGIALNSSFRTQYYVGEEMVDVAGGILDYTIGGKTTQVTITPDMVSGFTTETTGTRNMVVTYQNFTITVAYTVKSAPDYPLDTTGTVVYKSLEINNGNSIAVMLKSDKLYMATFEEGMTFDETHAITLYSKTFNSKDRSWEVVTMAVNGGYYKLTQVTANSFIISTYETETADLGVEVDPDLTQEEAVSVFHCAKV